ncbi:hypothetical protein ACOTTU_17725 [Roseobacter sp. EG26]|uniref:hypothetical protein n=1 Tax=Roseobacter sp. EG26 TaxID=3412477 RepID=UPI003CE525B1
MTYFAKTAMILSICYYCIILGVLWIGQILGVHNGIWEAFDFPQQDTSPPVWTLIIGLIMTGTALCCLASAYRAAWTILGGGPKQDFRDLGQNLKRMAWGLIGFWVGYNLVSGVMQYLIIIGLPSTDGFEFGWDPLDLDIIFAIVGVVLLAISQTLERAWLAEDENSQFL